MGDDFGITFQPDTDQDQIHVDFSGLVAFQGQTHSSVGVVQLRHLGTGADIDALLLQPGGQTLTQVGVFSRKDVGHKLNEGHLGTEGIPDAGKLGTNSPRSNDPDALGKLGQLQGVRAANHRLAVELESRKLGRTSPRRDNDGGGFNSLIPHGNGAGCENLCLTLDDVDAVPLEECGDTTGIHSDDLVLPGDHGGHIKTDGFGLEPILGCMLHLPVHLGGIYECFCRYASNI